MIELFRNSRVAAFKFLATFALILMASNSLDAQSGWQTVKDKTGSCQISVPPNWTVSSIPGLVNSLQSKTTLVISGNRPYRPFSSETLRVLKVDKVLENSAARLVYETKQSRNSLFVNFHVEVPGKLNSCITQITVPLSSEDDGKKIALTLTKTP